MFEGEANCLMSTGTGLETEPMSSSFSTRKNESEIVNRRMNRVKRELNHKMCVGVAREVPNASTVHVELYSRDRENA